MREKLLKIQEIEHMMAAVLDGSQLKRLHDVLNQCLLSGEDFEVALGTFGSNEEVLEAFLCAKRLEGCSERSLRYYATTLRRFMTQIDKPVSRVSTDDVRQYLIDYQACGTLSNVTADNIRRVISSLFSWLEIEDLIYKSPVRRIKKIRSTKSVKPVISDEAMVVLRDGCAT